MVISIIFVLVLMEHLKYGFSVTELIASGWFIYNYLFTIGSGYNILQTTFITSHKYSDIYPLVLVPRHSRDVKIAYFSAM